MASSPMACTRGLKPAESAPKTSRRMLPSGMKPDPSSVTYPVLRSSRQEPRTPVVRYGSWKRALDAPMIPSTKPLSPW